MSLFDELDFILANLEDSAHGEDAINIHKARSLVSLLIKKYEYKNIVKKIDSKYCTCDDPDLNILENGEIICQKCLKKIKR